MLKNCLIAIAGLLATMSIAFAQVDVNKADQAQLDAVKGIGPATAKAILAERKKGDFKDWADLESRVNGIKDKRAAKLSRAGLTVNGQALAGAPAEDANPKKDDKKADAKSEGKASAKPVAKAAQKGAGDQSSGSSTSSSSPNPFGAK